MVSQGYERRTHTYIVGMYISLTVWEVLHYPLLYTHSHSATFTVSWDAADCSALLMVLILPSSVHSHNQFITLYVCILIFPGKWLDTETLCLMDLFI